jgi:putative ABC transport system permease protein
VGIAGGGIAAWALGRVLASIQYDVTISDPVIWTTVVLVIGFTSVAAAWLPAHRARKADPALLLRED